MSVWNFIYEKYSAGIDVILLYVLESSGSSPGRQGFKMAVAADKSFTGSIGGGIMEYKFMEMAKSILASTTLQKQNRYQQVHSKDKGENRSGMICSGEQTIYLHKVNDSDMIAVSKIVEVQERDVHAILLLTPQGIGYAAEKSAENFYFEVNGDDFLLKEKMGKKHTLHIIGGGHCALALSRLMSQMDFYIHLYDDRKDLDTITKNSYVQEIHILESFSDLECMFQEKENGFVVIMTLGYRTDDLALRALLNKTFTYVGVMGSEKKIQEMFQVYRKEGIEEESIQRLHAPIGLEIKSQTPEEIAVSIAAQIIRIKNAGI